MKKLFAVLKRLFAIFNQLLVVFALSCCTFATVAMLVDWMEVPWLVEHDVLGVLIITAIVLITPIFFVFGFKRLPMGLKMRIKFWFYPIVDTVKPVVVLVYAVVRPITGLISAIFIGILWRTLVRLIFQNYDDTNPLDPLE